MKRALACACCCLAVACTRDLQLPPLPGPGTLYGRVVIAVPGSETPTPAAGASVSLLGSSASTTSASDGSFFLSGIVQTSGSLLFQVDPDGHGGYSHQTVVSLAQVGAGPGRQISLGDVLVGANAQMHGRVLLGDRVGQPGGQGGTTVFVPAAPYTTITNDDGTFTLASLPSGPIQVSMFHAAYDGASIGTVQLGAGQSYAVADVILAPHPGTQLPGTISGSVTFQPDLSTATGTTVTANPIAGSPVQAQVNADGTFSIPNLVPNLYGLQVSHASYTPATVLNVLVQPGEQVVIPEIVLTTHPPIDAGQGTAGGDAGRQPGSPLASAGPPGAVRLGFAYSLDASGSSDPTGETLFYSWTQTAGAPVSLSINDSILASRPTFEAPIAPDTLKFTVTVTNTSGLSDSASTSVAVVPAPVALVTPNIVTLRPGESALLDGSQSSDPTGTRLQYAWSQPAGNLALDGGTTGPTISVTATASGVSTVQLVVSNGFISSDPAVVTVTSGAAPTVHVNAGVGQTVGTGSGVILTGSAISTDPNDVFIYSWAQTSGAQVTLLNASSASASFQAPLVAGPLQFQLSASSDTAGFGSATTTVDVEDLTPPAIVAMNPAVDGGIGSWMYASATFDKPLDPASVTAANVFISPGDGGAPIPAAIDYDATRNTVNVVPNTPLANGAPYTFTVGAVTDSSPAHNVHSPAVSINYLTSTPQWQFWASALSNGPGVQAPNPGIAVTSREVDVFGRRWEVGVCSPGTWVMNPGPDGGLLDQSLCLSFGNNGVPIGRIGNVAAGVAYGFVIGGCGSCGPGEVFEEQGDGGWLVLTAGPPTMVSDGTSLYGPATGYNGSLAFFTYNPACSGAWCQEIIDPALIYDPNNMGGAATPGKVMAAGWRNAGNNVFYLAAYERGGIGTPWAQLDGGQTGASIDWSNGQSPSRFAYAHGDPFGVYAANNPTSQLVAVAWSSAAAKWMLYPVASGNVGSFDVFARGDTAWIAFVAGQQLYLDRIDLSSPNPALVPVPGPNGLSLNNGATCLPGHPELFVSDDSVWLTWHETCAPNVWQVFLRQMF